MPFPLFFANEILPITQNRFLGTFPDTSQLEFLSRAAASMPAPIFYTLLHPCILALRSGMGPRRIARIWVEHPEGRQSRLSIFDGGCIGQTFCSMSMGVRPSDINSSCSSCHSDITGPVVQKAGQTQRLRPSRRTMWARYLPFVSLNVLI